MEALLANINNKALGRIFLNSLNDICYGEFKARIRNNFTKGTDIYPRM